MSALNLHSMSLSILNEYFGYDVFRTGQQEIINSIVSGKDTLVIMPTGGGKSLCYQIPALMLPGTAIIISPLIALMKDQVDGLLERNIPAALINSTVSQHDQQIIARDIVNGRIKLLYISPERLQNPQFMAFLRTIEISFIAVDEAHCISEWGHDFRPAYTSISNAFRDLGKRPPIIALTATATPEVKEDIAEESKSEKKTKSAKAVKEAKPAKAVKAASTPKASVKSASGAKKVAAVKTGSSRGK